MEFHSKTVQLQLLLPQPQENILCNWFQGAFMRVQLYLQKSTKSTDSTYKIVHDNCDTWQLWHMTTVTHDTCDTWKLWHITTVTHYNCDTSWCFVKMSYCARVAAPRLRRQYYVVASSSFIYKSKYNPTAAQPAKHYMQHKDVPYAIFAAKDFGSSKAGSLG